MRVCRRCGRREALALSRWPEEPAGGRRQEENKRQPPFLGPRVFSQVCRSSSEACGCAWRAPACVRGDAVWVCASRRDSCSGVHRNSPLPQQNLRCPLHLLPVLGAHGCSAGEDEPRCTASRANVHNLSEVLHSTYAFPYCAAGPRHPQGAQSHPASQPPRTQQDSAFSSSLSPGAAASAPAPTLQKATPHRGRAVFIRNRTQRAGLLWQVCSKYWLERGGQLSSGNYTLLPRETSPPCAGPSLAQQKVSVDGGRVDVAPSRSGTADRRRNEVSPLGSESI